MMKRTANPVEANDAAFHIGRNPHPSRERGRKLFVESVARSCTTNPRKTIAAFYLEIAIIVHPAPLPSISTTVVKSIIYKKNSRLLPFPLRETSPAGTKPSHRKLMVLMV